MHKNCLLCLGVIEPPRPGTNEVPICDHCGDKLKDPHIALECSKILQWSRLTDVLERLTHLAERRDDWYTDLHGGGN